MATWAIIKSGGKQYKVQEGDKLAVDKLGKSGKQDPFEFKEVLLISGENGIKIGKPFIEKAIVKAKILEDFKDKKVRVVKFKSKSRYLRVRGHRQQKTKIEVTNIVS